MKNVTLVCIASSNVSDLTGHGLEFLTDKNGSIIAMFSEGVMGVSDSVIKVDAKELEIVTKIAA